MAKLNVKDTCIGCGMCVSQNEDLFEWNDEGLSSAKKVELTEEEANQAKEIAPMCPVDAIEVIEEDTEA